MPKRNLKIALAGNPNVGKTTIFNGITGSRQHVGNWPGVTVEKVIGKRSYKGREIEVVDLPGTYSLTPYSMDEIVARDYILNEKPDVVIDIVDATNLERNLYLTTQLMELGVHIVIALNMFDLAESKGDEIKVDLMEEYLEIPVAKTIGSKGIGIKDLLDKVLEEAEKGPHHEHNIGYGDEVERSIVELSRILKSEREIARKYPARWLSVKLLEGDEDALKKLKGSQVELKATQYVKSQDLEMLEAHIADKRYEVIGAVVPHFCVTCDTLTASDLIDHVFTNKYLGIPIFLAMMWAAFQLTFTIALPFMGLIDMGFAWMAETVNGTIQPNWLASLIGDGVLGGVGFVLIFTPNIFILFFLLSILEDSGYLARGAFVMDRVMYKIGLQGKSFIPMLMGFGCNVPAIMATRSIDDRKARLTTILINPFVSCGARLPVYVLLAGAFFGAAAGTVIFAIYALGILVAVLSAKLFRATLFKGDPQPFIMELPPYRVPTLKASLLHTWDRGKEYLKKAGTIILFGAVIIWFLASMPWGVEYGSGDSYAGTMGHVLEPVLAPLGFDWRIAVALIFGFVAKEVVVGSLGALYGAGEDTSSLTQTLQDSPSMYPLNAFGLMAFTLLYTPCLATVAVIKKETGSWKLTIFSIVYSLVVAYSIAFIIFQVGRLLGFG